MKEILGVHAVHSIRSIRTLRRSIARTEPRYRLPVILRTNEGFSRDDAHERWRHDGVSIGRRRRARSLADGSVLGRAAQRGAK
jgi:hypothetical protein